MLHEGHPTACVGDAAFGYVNAFMAHVGQREVHAPREAPAREAGVDGAALREPVALAYADMRRRRAEEEVERGLRGRLP